MTLSLRVHDLSVIKMKTCDWEEIPSHFHFFNNVSGMLSDLFMGRYTSSCLSHVPWWYRFTSLDYFLLLLFTSCLGLFYTRARLLLYQLFAKRFECDDSNLRRASEVSCQVIVRLFSIIWTSIVIFYLPSCSILSNTSSSWSFLDQTQHPTRMIPLYCFATSMYLWHLISLIFVDEKRKDFNILFIHHAVTLLAIVMSYTIKFYDMGLLIYFLHDFNDPFLEVAKIFHYIKVDKEGYLNRTLSNISDTFMVLFAISWVPTRLYLYPLRGIHALTKISRESCDFNQVASGASLLFTLYLLNFLWFFMLSKAVINRIILGGFTDETMDDPDAEEICKQRSSKRRKRSSFTSDFIDDIDQVRNRSENREKLVTKNK